MKTSFLRSSTLLMAGLILLPCGCGMSSHHTNASDVAASDRPDLMMNLIDNGSFEFIDNSVANPLPATHSNGQPFNKWQVSAPPLQAIGVIPNNYAGTGQIFYKTLAGNDFLYLGMNPNPKPGDTPNAAPYPNCRLSQDISPPLAMGQYTISFKQSVFRPDDDPALKEIDGSVEVIFQLTGSGIVPANPPVYTVKHGITGWVSQSYNVTVPQAGLYTIAFVSSDQTAVSLIDDVSLIKK